MDSADALLGGLAAGDTGSAPVLEPAQVAPIKREHDSTDDFEHLGGEKESRSSGESPFHAPRVATRDFLDMERGPSVEPPRAPSATDRLADQLADKFTDSESDADTGGESPLHRAQPAPQAAADVPKVPPPAAAAPPVPPSVPLPEPKPEPKPQPKPEPKPESKAESQAKGAPEAPPAQKPSAPAPAPPAAAAKAAPRAPVAHVIEAEVIFCRMGLDAWFDPQRLHPEVESLIYWRDVVRSGVALALGLAVLVALACCSVVSVLAYSSLLALSAAVAFRVYKNVLQAVQKTNEGHPFKWLLEQDISVPAERAQALAAAATAHLNASSNELRRLFLVEDLVDSLKFGVLLWCLTYVGACFNGITLIILGWVALFTLPKAYEMNKAQVDSNLELARGKINEITAKVRAAVPLGRKSESDKDK